MSGHWFLAENCMMFYASQKLYQNSEFCIFFTFQKVIKIVYLNYLCTCNVYVLNNDEQFILSSSMLWDSVWHFSFWRRFRSPVSSPWQMAQQRITQINRVNHTREYCKAVRISRNWSISSNRNDRCMYKILTDSPGEQTSWNTRSIAVFQRSTSSQPSFRIKCSRARSRAQWVNNSDAGCSQCSSGMLSRHCMN